MFPQYDPYNFDFLNPTATSTFLQQGSVADERQTSNLGLNTFEATSYLPLARVAGIEGASEGDGEAFKQEHGGSPSSDGQVSSKGISPEDSLREMSPGEAKKKPRVTLARGGACVNCRNRKLKCSGDKPCKTCQKTDVPCRYEEVQRRRPRAILMEERVFELESLLATSGIPVPPSPLHSNTPTGDPFSPQRSNSSSSAGRKIHPPPIYSALYNVSANTSSVDIAPNSSLEVALLHVVLPHTPYISIPLHAARFLALVNLPAGHPNRPHPALLYILFAEAVRILENNTPPPPPRSLPNGLYGYNRTPTIHSSRFDRSSLLSQVHGTSLALLERARHELGEGIKHVDRPFDLVRAAVGIARHLYSLGRFIEGWGIPVSRLAISCGLHRISGQIVSPDPNQEPGIMPLPYATTQYYIHHQAIIAPVRPDRPRLRMRPTILAPARDAIDVAERTMTWWAVKAQDWSAGIGWGWVTALNDADCTTRWPWGWGPVQVQPDLGERHTLADLFDPTSSMRNVIDTTYTLAIQSLCLLHRASDLFDIASTGSPESNAFNAHLNLINQCTSIEAAIDLLRSRIPLALTHPTPSSQEGTTSPQYDGFSDPWWIQLHANIYTTEMLLYSELARHRQGAYERAIRSARAMVPLISRVRSDQWTHVDMIVAIDISLVARFLNKEAARLLALNQLEPSRMAADDAETLKMTLERDFSRCMPMAGLHAMIVQRVKEGWSEKEGEYERV